ncbi:MAG: hypothetical protein ACTSW1_11460 [Candidatus Hodarchaeales archaeon]
MRCGRRVTLLVFLIVFVTSLHLSIDNLSKGEFSEKSGVENTWPTTKLDLDTQGAFTGVLQIENKVDQTTLLMVAYKKKIVSFSLNSANESSWVIDITDAFVWRIIPNSLKESDVTGAYISLSNGTLFALSINGSVNWRKTISNKSLSSLELIEDGDGGYLVIAGGDGREVFWLNSTGSIRNNAAIESEITLMKTKGQYLAFGTRSGEYYLYKGTSLVWNKTLSQYPCLAIAINRDYVIVYNYGNNIKFLSLSSGIEQFQLSFGVVLLDFLQVEDGNEALLYIALTSGDLVLFNITGMDIEWTHSLIYPTGLRFYEFTGDSNKDLIIGTSKGEIVLLNQSTSLPIKKQEIIPGHVDVMEILPTNFNNDTLTDLIVFGLNGEVWVVTGLDLTPPEITNLVLTKISYNSYKVNVNSSEEVRLEIKYGEKLFEQTLSKPEFSTSHVVYLTNLKSNTKYILQIEVWDKNGNSQKSEVITFQTSVPAPPYFLIFVAILVTVGVGSASFGMFKYKQRQRKVAYSEAILAQKDKNFTKAIQLFHKANAGDEIVELVETILKDPSLAEEAGQILQMKEVESYLSSMQDVIKKAKESM